MGRRAVDQAGGHGGDAMMPPARFLAALAFALALACGAAFGQTAGVSPSQMFGCNRSAFYDNNIATPTRLVQGASTGQIYVCGWNILAAAAVNVDHLPVYTGITPVPAGNDLCINPSAAVAIQAIVYYTQF